MLMPHRRPERKLAINQSRDHESKNNQRLTGSDPPKLSEASPDRRKRQRDHYQQTKKSLGETGVKDSDLILQQGDAQTAEYALQNRPRLTNPAENF